MHNFDLQATDFDPATRRITLTVVDSPAGQVGPVPSVVPSLSLVQALAASRSHLDEMGDAFTAALLPPPLWLAWRESVGHAGEAGLRLRIRTQDAACAALPWELLRDKARRVFLAQDPSTPVVRYLHGPVPLSTRRLADPLSILALSAQPTSLPDLTATPFPAGSSAGSLALRRGDHLQARQIKSLLLKHRPHILHFDGHALWDEIAGQGMLLLEDSLGNPDPLAGEILAKLLRGHGVGLVVLNACETAQGGDDPWAGLAQGLVLAGVPAVVAMGSEVKDRAAATFAESFYTALSVGQPVDRAITHARLAMAALPTVRPGEWLIPALFLRVADGQLWEVPEAPPQAQPSIAPTTGGVFFNGPTQIGNFFTGGTVLDQRGSTFTIGGAGQSGDTAKLDQLLAGQATIQAQIGDLRATLLARYDAGERHMLQAIVARLDAGQIAQAEAVAAAVEAGQIDNVQAAQLLAQLEGILAALTGQAERLAELSDVQEILSAPGLDFKHKLKIAAPIIPFVLAYEGEIELGSGINLEGAWNAMLARLRRN